MDVVGAGQWMLTDNGVQRTTGTPVLGRAVVVTVRSGHRLVADAGTELLVARGRQLRAVPLHGLSAGDFAVIGYGGAWPSSSPPLRSFEPTPSYGSQKRVVIPTGMTEQLAFFLGAYVSEGHISRSNWSVVITNAVPEVLERVAAAVEDAFQTSARVVYPPARCAYVVVASKRIVEFLDHLRCGHRSQVKRIPDWILRCSWEHVRAFMEGLFLDAFTAWMGRTPKWGICVASPGLLDDVQAVLTNLGIVHGRCTKRDAATGNVFGEVYAVGEHAQALLRAVPFAEPEKRARAEERLLATPAQSTADVVPIIDPSELAELVPRAPRGRRSRTPFGFLRDPRTRNVSRRTLERVSELPGVELDGLLRRVLDDRLRFVPVVEVSAVEDAQLVSPRATPARGIGGFVSSRWLEGDTDVAREHGPEYVLTLAGPAEAGEHRSDASAAVRVAGATVNRPAAGWAAKLSARQSPLRAPPQSRQPLEVAVRNPMNHCARRSSRQLDVPRSSLATNRCGNSVGRGVLDALKINDHAGR